MDRLGPRYSMGNTGGSVFLQYSCGETSNQPFCGVVGGTGETSGADGKRTGAAARLKFGCTVRGGRGAKMVRFMLAGAAGCRLGNLCSGRQREPLQATTVGIRYPHAILLPQSTALIFADHPAVFCGPLPAPRAPPAKRTFFFTL